MNYFEEDHSAIGASANSGAALCTIVNIDGSFSRRLGAQLAINPDGSIVGSLSDGCLESQLATDLAECDGPIVKRYGQGSDVIDFRLPCGGGLDILLDPAPDRQSCRLAVATLKQRNPARIALPSNSFLSERHYIPALQIRTFGEEPELGCFARLAEASGIACESFDKSELSLGQTPSISPPDRWTATILLYHDHEWENTILKHAIESDAFYIGAQGGENSRKERIARLTEEGVEHSQISRVRGPVGVIPSSREPRSLALSILSEIVGEYEALHPHA